MAARRRHDDRWLGNDTFYVDNAGDTVKENSNEGTDTVFANVNYTLGAGTSIQFLRANAGAPASC